ncbi:CPBP family intramembrane metalloprotease [Staphylococcus simulans]|uniref:CPBP family intramembrane glutamic endopeptidase n=1 Tax=Staphylococcus simulans TaxID=1286 RepID=UPI0021D097EF|nr:CPBP family intramembrane glutamic endopeptidase [Staphylococcus simulans]UXR48063.1 CPBP family intramembrane metalloprotease [Staphylococcus simulans]WMM10860.1 CPBP family intramembrane metalloprotease [Staphylococcus simulans]
MTQTTKTLENPFDSTKVMKRDFFLFPLSFFLLFGAAVLLQLVLGLYYGATNREVPMIKYEEFGGIAQDVSSLSLLFIFYLMHRRYLIPIAKERIRRAFKLWYLIIGGGIVVFTLNAGIGYLLEHVLHLDNTQNQAMIEAMFEHQWLWPFLFISIVVLAPIVEELLYRHVIIHELGKKIGNVLATLLSIILFAGIHMMYATSIYEALPYVMMGTVFSIVYLMSRKNLAVAILLHAFNNAIGFILMLFS